MKRTLSRPKIKRRPRGLGATAGLTRDLVTGADEHIDRVRKAMWLQGFIAVGLAVAFRGLLAWNDLSERLGSDATSSPTIRIEPTSGSNILAAYALLGALLFALQVSVRSLNNEPDLAKQLDPAELGRRQMVGFLAITAGIAAFGMAILCLYWYGDVGSQLDLFRVLGPIGASVVLAAIAADTFVTTEAPLNSQLRMELEKQTLRTAEEAYGRVPRLPEDLNLGLVAARAVILVLTVSAISWTAWLLAMRDAQLGLAVAGAVFTLIATLLVCWTSITATASLARREILQSATTITTAILILVLYAGASWVPFFQATGQDSEPAAYRTALASVALYFGPAILAPLFSLRGFNGNHPGVLVILAARRLQRQIRAIQDAAAKEHEKLKLDPAVRKRKRRARAALWLSPLPLVPQLLLRLSDVGRLPDENQRDRRLAMILSWAFSGTYLLVAVHAAIVWMQ
ncbi:hypothetical protein [Curtobacterium herbarum]|uniref:hypothetical protein n=1 Tax=Curtobacterium herbarum TaxID=150122 RepID=UPI001C8E5670|nr:hypothetical protein [Curtobacterium herbarum]MBY0175548.1 hypothetical protein [Curtobacterium herbarum]